VDFHRKLAIMKQTSSRRQHRVPPRPRPPPHGRQGLRQQRLARGGRQHGAHLARRLRRGPGARRRAARRPLHRPDAPLHADALRRGQRVAPADPSDDVLGGKASCDYACGLKEGDNVETEEGDNVETGTYWPPGARPADSKENPSR
jgi:hypothetical protein